MDAGEQYVGRILDNRYEIIELIGTGGMALVYKARCHRLNRMVAVKILKEDLADDEDFRRRFHTESQAVAMLSHPNIVAVYDVSRSGNVEYIVMELIEGITLKQYISRKGLLNWKEALHFTTQVTKALSHAHSRGIIHRDIKPHNIMILKDGSVKVADFGIARLLSGQSTLTQDALGSVHYISPEQAKGSNVDARSDIYSLGVVMYEMLTSRLPFVGESAVSVAIQHISAIPLMPRDINPEIPIGLEDITMHAMESDINLRFATADEMLRDLEEFRKNPSTVYNYAMSDPQLKQQPDYTEFQDTRPLSRGNGKQDGAGARSEHGVAVRSEHGIVRAERGAPGKRRALAKPNMTADEYRMVKTRAVNTSTLVGIFIVVVFIAVLAIILVDQIAPYLTPTDEVDKITIPSFVNRRLDDVQNNDEYLRLYTFNVQRERNSDYPDGVIIRQNPAADRQQDPPLPGRKTPITLYVSEGMEPPKTIPDGLVGLHYVEASNRLNRLYLNLKVETEQEASDTVEKGYVIATRPVSGAEITNGDTVVVIYSGGPVLNTNKVPDFLVGRTKEELEEIFTKLEFTPEYVYFESDTIPEDQVMYVESEGEDITIPAIIRVALSSGPKKVLVPENLVGRDIAYVEDLLRGLDLITDVRYVESQSPQGVVLTVGNSGQEVAIRSTILITASSGPPAPPPPPDPITDPDPTPTETTTETPPPDPTTENTDPVTDPGGGDQPTDDGGEDAGANE